MSFLKSIDSINVQIHPWQAACLETIDRLIAPYFFYPEFYGLYIYGPPGRGKTFLIDLVDSYEAVQSYRYHFFSLCSALQDQLNTHDDQDFTKFFAQISSKAIVLIDEVIIEDIADAMLFARWFKKLQQKKIRIIMTSNIAIDNLYLGGLKRDAFIPTISQMNQYCQRYKLESEFDLRTQHSSTHKIFYPIEQRKEAVSLVNCPLEHKEIKLGTARDLSVYAQNATSLAVDSRCLFSHEAGKFDYKYLTTQFHNLILCEMHLFLWNDPTWCKRMVAFIDYAFDHQTKLYFHGLESYQQLQQNFGSYSWPDRTLSRFNQICSKSWH